MTNLRTTPNRMQFQRDSTFTAHFGTLCTVIPMNHVRGLGHSEYVSVHFAGLSLELTPADAVELARRLPEAIAALPIEPDLSGSCARIDEEKFV